MCGPKRGAKRKVFPVEISHAPVIFPSCRSTSFIAESARRTAKSWCVQAIGREQNVRIAVRASWRKSFLPSHLVRQVKAHLPRTVVPASRVPAACAAPAGRTGTEEIISRKLRWPARASNPRPSSRLCAVSVRRTSRRRWPRPEPLRRWRDRTGCPVACHR